MTSERMQAFKLLAAGEEVQGQKLPLPLPLWVPDKLACLPRDDTRALVIWQPADEEGTVICDVAYYVPGATPDSIRIECDVRTMIKDASVVPSRLTFEITSPTTQPSTTAPVDMVQ